MSAWRWWCATAALAAAMNGAVSPASAGELRVLFDAPDVVMVRDVVDAAHEVDPADKLVEVRFDVSTLVRSAGEGGLIECLYRIQLPPGPARVVDYEPKTTLASEVIGQYAVDEKHGKSQSLGMNLSGSWSDIRGVANASAGADDSVVLRYQKLPPLELLAASGTLDRGRGAYFKLKPSSRTTLEGARAVQLLLRVPRGWRGDGLHLRCEAVAERRVRTPLPSTERYACGLGEFVIGLHAPGDEEARWAAQRLPAARARLLAEAVRQRDEIERRAWPNPWRQAAGALSLAEPKINPHWLSQVLSAAPGELPDTLNHLPGEVRQAAIAYAAARNELSRLNGAGGASVVAVDPAGPVRVRVADTPAVVSTSSPNTPNTPNTPNADANAD